MEIPYTQYPKMTFFANKIIVTGGTDDANFTITSNAEQKVKSDNYDGTLTIVNPTSSMYFIYYFKFIYI